MRHAHCAVFSYLTRPHQPVRSAPSACRQRLTRFIIWDNRITQLPRNETLAIPHTNSQYATAIINVVTAIVKVATFITATDAYITGNDTTIIAISIHNCYCYCYCCCYCCYFNTLLLLPVLLLLPHT